MRKLTSLLATAALTAGLSLATAAPASAAGPYCFGLPDYPLAYVCITVHEPSPNPTITWGEPFYVTDVPAVCYGLGCTERTPLYVSIPWVSGLGVSPNLVEVYWGGQGEVDPKGLVAAIRESAESLLQCVRPPFVCPA